MSSKLHKNQQGLVSITVTVIIMVVVTLIVSSFALITRREQRRSLDRQLNTQALNAIEAGVADAQAAITANRLTDDITECTGSNSFINKAALNPTINKVGENVEYSCVLIDQGVQSWTKSSANPEDGAFIVPIKAATAIGTLRIGWQEKSGSDSFVSDAIFADRSHNLLKAGMGSPMLRVTIFPGLSGQTRNDLKNAAHTMFLYPVGAAQGSAGSIGYLNNDPNQQTHDSQGAFVSGNCNQGNADNSSVSSLPAKYYCNVDITGLNDTKYYVVIQPLYKSAAIDIQGFDSSNSVVTLSGSQATVDVTARAGDVLRRAQVRVPIGEGFELNGFKGIFPDAALSTTDSICKLWSHDNNNVTSGSCPAIP